jgi:lanti_perm_MutE: lantibiotic protection ABC transporter permease subunit, MutE/EpiE family
MEMAYIQAENLKHKRTFTKTLIVLAPFVTALMNFFVPLWFQLNSYNWWYILSLSWIPYAHLCLD